MMLITNGTPIKLMKKKLKISETKKLKIKPQSPEKKFNSHFSYICSIYSYMYQCMYNYLQVLANVYMCICVYLLVSVYCSYTTNKRHVQSQTNISPTRSFYLFPPNSLFEKVNICMISCPSFKSQQKAWPSLSIPGPSHRIRSQSRRGRNTWAQRQLGLVRSHQAPPHVISCLIFIFFLLNRFTSSLFQKPLKLYT